MKNKLLLMFSALGLIAGTSTYAGSMATAPASSAWHTVLGIGGGPSFSTTVGHSLTFPITNPLTDEYYNYTANHSAQTRGLVEAFLGAEHSLLSSAWLLQAGLAYSQTASFQARGTFIQGADALSADQYTYQYHLVGRTLLAQAKFMYPYGKLYPYLLVGLGGSFNTASNYTTNVPPFLTFTRDYLNNTSRSFTYKVGVGADVDITEHARLGLAYRFSDLGHASLGSANIDGVPVPGTLSQSQWYTNDLLVQLTYRI